MMEKRELNLIVVAALIVAIVLGVLGGGIAWFTLYRAAQVQQAQLTQIQAQLRAGQNRFPSVGIGVAAAGSVERQLQSQGKRWVRTAGEITVGAYVEDIFENRMNQPQGRGAIGKVVSVTGPNDPPPPCATVDFGRGYLTGINLSELSLVRIVPKNQ